MTSSPAAPRVGAAGWTALAVLAIVLGVLGCTVWLLPIDLSAVRHVLPLALGTPGLCVALACLAARRSLAVAAVGFVLSGLAFLLGVLLVVHDLL